MTRSAAQVRVMKRHEKHRDSHLAVGVCWECGRQRAKCEAKKKFAEWEDAQECADRKNQATDWELMLLCYECDWCSGFHLARARGSSRINAVKKRRNKYLIRQS